MPLRALPLPTCVDHKTTPSLSGSRAQTVPDFWPTTSISLPSDRLTSIGDMPKSRSGPGGYGQFRPRGREQHAMLQAYSDVAWKNQASSPISMSSATIASLVAVAGRE